MSHCQETHDLNADTWDRCDDLATFGQFFHRVGPLPPDRKFRLYLAGTIRTFWDQVTDPRSRAAVEAAERYADDPDPSILAAASPGTKAAADEAAGRFDPDVPASSRENTTTSAALRCLVDDVRNGLCLCSLHHKLFDRGALTLSPDGQQVWVSERANGRNVERALGRFHGRKVARPNRADDAPAPEFVSWHHTEVFQGRPRG
jgi:hypothetical protein